VPLTASILCVAAIIVPLWFVLPENWTFQASALYGSLAVPGVLLSLYLIHLWAGRVRGPAWTGRRLTMVPLILLTLASLELIRFRNSDVIWGAVILVGLCVLLALFGWIEENSGLESVRVPEEVWRVDRLPEAES
jgi:phosphatidylglycerophosphate synthase